MKSRSLLFAKSLLLLFAFAAIAWLLWQEPPKLDERNLIVRLKPKKGKGHQIDTLTVFNGDTVFSVDGEIMHSSERDSFPF